MPRYLVEADHPPDPLACIRAVRDILRMGSHFTTHAEFGCSDGVHTGWILIEAASHAEARQVLPPRDREGARVTRLRRFRLDELEELERKHRG